jgi:hypothetical protein
MGANAGFQFSVPAGAEGDLRRAAAANDPEGQEEEDENVDAGIDGGGGDGGPYSSRLWFVFSRKCRQVATPDGI